MIIFCFYIWQHTVTSAVKGLIPIDEVLPFEIPATKCVAVQGIVFVDEPVTDGWTQQYARAPVVQHAHLKHRWCARGKVHDHYTSGNVPFHATKKLILPAMLDQNDAANIQRWKTR